MLKEVKYSTEEYMKQSELFKNIKVGDIIEFTYSFNRYKVLSKISNESFTAVRILSKYKTQTIFNIYSANEFSNLGNNPYMGE